MISVNAGATTGAVNLTQSGTYEILYAPNEAANATFTVQQLLPPAAASISANGNVVSVSTTVSYQGIQLNFSGTAGQVVSLLVTETCAANQSASAFCGGGADTPQQITVIGPAEGTGTIEIWPNTATYGNLNTSTTEGFWNGAFTLPSTGDYTITLTEGLANTGTANFTLSTVPQTSVAVTSSQYGTSIPFTTTAEGQSAVLTFSGNAGDTFSVLATETCTSSYSSTSLCGGGSDTPQTVTVTTSAAGGGVTTVWSAGAAYGNLNTSTTEGFWSGAFTLPASGTYTITLTDEWPNVGTANFTVSKITESTVAISSSQYGTAIPVNLTADGQSAILTFSGNAGDTFSLLASETCTSSYSNSSLCGGGSDTPQNVTVTTPASGGGVTTAWSVGNDYGNLNGSTTEEIWSQAFTLTATGTYTITLTDQWPNIGAANFTLYKMTEPVGSITENGPTVPVTTTVPGQSATLTFSGTAGDNVSLIASETCAASYSTSAFCGGGADTPETVTVTTPASGGGTTTVWSISTYGNANTDSAEVFSSGNFTLPSTALYTITLTDQWTNTGTANFTLTKNNGQVVTRFNPGQKDALAFSGSAGQTVSLLVTEACNATALASCTSQFATPQVMTVAANGGASAATTAWSGLGGVEIDAKSSVKRIWTGPFQLPATGEYSIAVADGSLNNTTATFQLFHDTPSIISQPISIGGTPVNVSTQTPGQSAGISFVGAPHQMINFAVDTVFNSQSGNCYTVSILAAGKADPIWRSLECEPNFATGPIMLPSNAVGDSFTAFVTPSDTSVGTFRLKVGAL